jgi:hypothetical protein
MGHGEAKKSNAMNNTLAPKIRAPDLLQKQREEWITTMRSKTKIFN